MNRENELEKEELEKKRIAYENNIYSSSGLNSLKQDLLRDREKNRSIQLTQDSKYFTDRISSAYRGLQTVEVKEQDEDEIEVLDDETEIDAPVVAKHADYTIPCEKEEIPNPNEKMKEEVVKEEIKVPIPPKVEEKVKEVKEEKEKNVTVDELIDEQELIKPIEAKKEEKIESALIEVDTEDTTKKHPEKKEEALTKVLNYKKEEEPNKKEKKKEEKKLKKQQKKESKKEKKKMHLWEKIFCLASFSFIVGCCIFYGSRLIKYYKIYNPVSATGEKIELLSNSIAKGSPIVYEGPGLYMQNGSYTYKGREVNNYIKFSNLIWRIVRSNKDGSLDIVLDTSINHLMWNKELVNYTDSDIHKYLNDEFLSQLNKDLLVKTTSCNDIVDDIKSFTCKDVTKDSYVRLLTISDYINSEVDEKTYIAETEKLWLSTRGNEFVWNVNEGNLSNSESTRTYGIKPVVTLKNTAAVLSGNGTIENPYRIEEEKKELQNGSYVTLGKDTWIVYKEEKDTVRLVLSNLYNDGNTTYRFSVKKAEFNPEEQYSLAYYLNNNFYNTLSYKDLLQDAEWYIGSYETSYKDAYEQKVTAKIASYNVIDTKYDIDSFGYHLITPATESENYILSDELMASKITMYRAIRPTICIKKLAIKNGEGTKESPYELEV